MDTWEIGLFLVFGGLGVVPLFFHARKAYDRTWGLAATLVLACVVVAIVWQSLPSDEFKPDLREVGRRAEQFIPLQRTSQDFVSSNACRSCHPREYSTWHDTYHRTMTQVASPKTVLAPFEGQTLNSHGQSYRLLREGDEYWVEMPNMEMERAQMDGPLLFPPEIFLALSQQNEASLSPTTMMSGPSAVLLGQVANYAATIGQVRRRIVMTTGSHSFQGYWVPTTKGRELIQFPWIYNIREKKWMPSEDAFIRPPDGDRRIAVWNTNCIQCHSVNARPGQAATLDSQVTEFGISCEACHGPGEVHVEHHRNPLNRYRLRHSDEADPTIVNPARLDAKASSQVCGQCHSAFQATNIRDDFWQVGNHYRAGDDLEKTHHLFHFNDPMAKQLDEKIAQAAYWSDGTMRVGGREYLAMTKSPCFEHGQGDQRMSCLSCHSMHDSDPDDQIAAGMSGNQACLQCHTKMKDDISAHTHHAADSAGSSCYNCHMPHTSYALFKAIRSHRVDSPNAEVSQRTGKPNACNQCHLDKTLQWTAEHLSTWYGHANPQLSEEHQKTAASLVWLLTGDAAQRAMTAWTFSWDEAKQVSGTDWQAPVLAHLLEDPYAPVRFISYDALRKLPGYKEFEFDFVAGRRHFAEARETALKSAKPASARDDGSLVLLRDDGTVDLRRLAELLRQRDDRPITLPE